MSADQLLAELRAHAGERDHREVLADALLEAGDPRGQLMRAQLDGRAPPAELVERCVARVREAVPGLERVRFEAGLVTELHVEAEQVAAIDLAWLRSEPLVRLVDALPSKDEEREAAIEARAEVWAACRGLALSTRLGGPAWAELAPKLGAWALDAIELSLGDLSGIAVGEGWPSIRAAHLSASHEGAIEGIIGGLSGLRRLRLSPEGFSPVILDRLVELEQLDHLDLRGLALADDLLERLRAWARAPGRSLRHERVSLAPPDLDDVFGARGLVWEPAPTLRARVVGVPGQSGGLASARGTELQFHRRDDPAWRRELDAPITALAAAQDRILVGRGDGQLEVHRCDDDDAPVETLAGPWSGPITALHALAPDHLGLVHRGGWELRRGEQVERGEDEPSALVVTREGHARAHGTRVVVSDGADERELELGEPVLALASDGTQVLAIAGREVWSLSPAGPTFVGTRSPGGRPALACEGELVIWTSGRQVAVLSRAGEQSSVAYPNSYSSDVAGELAIGDVSVLDQHTALVALEHGGVNLLGASGALKADEFPGEAHRRWLFVYGGDILIAD